ncbi:MAG: ribonuclease P protein component [Saezia sp.]
MNPICKKQAGLTVLRSQKEFDDVLNKNTQIKGSYFVLHYHIESLSTRTSHESCPFVDKSLSGVMKSGLIIPKRLAKRSVTRSLIKRQCRAKLVSCKGNLPEGAWIIRLKRPIDSTQWKSSSSLELKTLIRFELQSLFSKAIMQLGTSHSICCESVSK